MVKVQASRAENFEIITVVLEKPRLHVDVDKLVSISKLLLLQHKKNRLNQ